MKSKKTNKMFKVIPNGMVTDKFKFAEVAFVFNLA